MRIHLALAALVATLTSTPAIAAPRGEAVQALEALKTICIANRLDHDGALKAAEAKGWRPISDTELTELGGLSMVIKGMHLKRTAARRSPEGLILMVGEGGGAGHGCVIGFGAPFSDATAVMSRWIDVPRFEQISPAYDFWTFVERDGRRLPVKSLMGKIDMALVERATADRSMTSIAVIGRMEGEGAIYLYSVPPRRTPQPPEAKPSAFVPDPAFDRSSCEAARKEWDARPGAPESRFVITDTGIKKFLRADLNCDQRLSWEEYEQRGWEFISSQDADGNGLISRAEYMERKCGGGVSNRIRSGWTPAQIKSQRTMCENIATPDFKVSARMPRRTVIDRTSYSNISRVDFRRADRNRDGFLTIDKERRRYFYE